MDKKEQMSDELLAKYMSGKASPEEEAVVLDYLADNEENLDDFLNMTASIELQHGKEKTGNAQKIWKKIIWGVSAAAAIALLVIVGVFAFNHESNQGEEFAQKKQTTQTQNDKSTTSVRDTLDSSKDHKQISSKSIENIQTPAIHEPKLYADSAKKKNYANMIYPASKLTSISNEKKSVNFRWSTDAEKVILKITNLKGEELISKELKGQKGYSYMLAESHVCWETIFCFENGKRISKSGELTIETD